MVLDGARVLVVGASGFIGANLVSRLLLEGCKVRATIHVRPPVVEDSAIEYVPADLTSVDDCKRVVRGIDYVFMCAAATSGAAIMTSTPLVHVTPNVVMNTLLMDAAYAAKVQKFLFISSSAAYPPTGDRPVKEDEMFSGDPYPVYYPVGWMKRYAEVLCSMYAQRIDPPMPTVVIRPSNAYGPLDDYEFATSHMTAALIRRVVERHNPLEVWGTGEDIRDLIYIDDLVEGMVRTFNGTSSYSAVNIASGKGHSVNEVLQAIIEVDGYRDVDIRFDTSKPSTIPTRVIDISFAKTEFGFQAQTGLEEGLRSTVDWYRRSRNFPAIIR